jgi:hypothetical protein
MTLSPANIGPNDAIRVVDPDGTVTLVTFYPTESTAS